jgi:hypothetical protein
MAQDEGRWRSRNVLDVDMALCIFGIGGFISFGVVFSA